MSWISSVGDGGGGEVAESEPFSDGIDIVHKTSAKLFSLQNWQSFLHSPQSTDLGLEAAFVVE